MPASSHYSSPLGPLLTLATDAAIVFCDFTDRRNLSRCLACLTRRLGPLSPSENHPLLARLHHELDLYFTNPSHTFTLPLAPHGTPFQCRCWNYLLTIPPGQTRTYADQAQALGSVPRAVGQANAHNTLSLLIPCHRVLASTGELQGYASGLSRKRQLLEHEAALTSASLFAPTP